MSIPKPLKVYRTGNTGRCPSKEAQTLMGLRDHVWQCDIVVAARTKKACIELADQLGVHIYADDFRPATGTAIDAMTDAGLFAEPAVYALPLVSRGGDGVIKVPARGQVELVGHLESLPGRAYRLVHQSEKEQGDG